MRHTFLFLALVLLVSCKQDQAKKPQTLEIGTYRTLLNVQDNEKLAFNFEVTSKDNLRIFNAEEVIEVDKITYRNDSVFINFPIYEGYLAAKFDGKNLKGNYIKESLDRVVPFTAEYNNEQRFLVTSKHSENVTGIWEAVFSEGVEDDEYVAKGIFKQDNNKVTGTFRTTTGDYRFLEGTMDGNKMKLSAFDGAHAFLFTATVSDSTMQGQFYSGNHWKEPFVAKRNSEYQLPDENTLTYLNEGYDNIEFSFPDPNGKLVSLSDDRFKDKVVLVQIMGTWCPNCLDESKFYTDYYSNNKSKDLEFVALAFEYAKTEEKAFAGISRLKERLNIEYPILLAQYGTSDKVKAQEKLPMLNHVLSYPTTIYIDKKGEVRKIHTGFNGPATGEKYAAFKEEFNGLIDILLKEE